MFKEIIQEIIISGMSETDIAVELKSTQPTINRIKNGKVQPLGQLAVALIGLRKSREEEYRSALNKAI